MAHAPAVIAHDEDPAENALRAFVVARRRQDAEAMRRAWRDLLGSEWARIRAFAATHRHQGLEGGRLSPEQQDEVAQEVVIRLLDKLNFEGDSIGALRAYLHTATGYAFADEVRRFVKDDIARAGSLDAPATDGEGPGAVARDAEREASERVLGDIERARIAAAFEEALGHVDEDKRQVVRMSLDGHSAEEIAQAVGISAQNVYQRKHRGTAQLREHLRKML